MIIQIEVTDPVQFVAAVMRMRIALAAGVSMGITVASKDGTPPYQGVVVAAHPDKLMLSVWRT
jgi:hypothetical protein